MPWRGFVLIGVPVLIVIGTLVTVRVDHARAREGLIEPGAIAWDLPSGAARVAVRRERTGEVDRFAIAVLRGETTVHATTFSIDHDLYGGGFVGGLDLDGDGVPSLVLATRGGPAASRVVEPGPDGIVERGFDALPAEHWGAVRARLDRIGPGAGAMVAVTVAFAWLVLGVAVYGVIGLRALVRAAIRARRGQR